MKLHQDKQFIPSNEAVRSILKAYGLEFVSFGPAASGIENCTLLIKTLDAQYALRIYRKHKKSDAEIHQELAFVEHLLVNGIKTVPAVPNNSGSLLTNYQSWQAVLTRFVSGDHAPSYTRPLLKDMACTQARMHILADSFKDVFGVSNRLFESNQTYRTKHVDRQLITDRLLLDFLARAEQYVVALGARLPTGLCHLDYDRENILSDNSGTITAILDFDDLAEAPYVACLGYTLWDIAMQDDESLVEYYCKVYESTRKLSDYEKSLIPKMMLFRNYVITSNRLLWSRLDENELKMYLKVEKMLLSDGFDF